LLKPLQIANKRRFTGHLHLPENDVKPLEVELTTNVRSLRAVQFHRGLIQCQMKHSTK